MLNQLKRSFKCVHQKMTNQMSTKIRPPKKMTNQTSTKKRPPKKKSKRTRGRRKNVHQNLVYRRNNYFQSRLNASVLFMYSRRHEEVQNSELICLSSVFERETLVLWAKKLGRTITSLFALVLHNSLSLGKTN